MQEEENHRPSVDKNIVNHVTRLRTITVNLNPGGLME